MSSFGGAKRTSGRTSEMSPFDPIPRCESATTRPGVTDFAIFCSWTTTLCSRIEMLKWVVSQRRSLVLMANPATAHPHYLGKRRNTWSDQDSGTRSHRGDWFDTRCRSLAWIFIPLCLAIGTIRQRHVMQPCRCDGSGWLQAGLSKTHRHRKASCCNLPRNRKPSAYCVLSRTPSTHHNVTKASAVDRSCRTG